MPKLVESNNATQILFICEKNRLALIDLIGYEKIIRYKLEIKEKG